MLNQYLCDNYQYLTNNYQSLPILTYSNQYLFDAGPIFN